MEEKPIYLIGDSHGAWENVYKKIDYLGIKDCYILHVGDVGIGFKPEDKQYREFEYLNSFFSARNILFKAVRGNHDHKKYFDENVNLSNFELIPDYSYRTFNGEKFLFVGGGVSIDRYTVDSKGRPFRVKDISWWEDEGFNFKPELVEEVDVLVTHSGPAWIGPNEKNGIAMFCRQDPTLWEECLEERRLHDELFKLAKPKKYYMGHFHVSAFVDMSGCDVRILDILEIIEHRKKQE